MGEKLVNLHLLKDPSLNNFSARFLGEGDSNKDEKLFINKTQYFYPVKREVYEYKIGGYQVLKKWLKDRKDRILNYSEITTFLKIIKAIEETIKIETTLKLIEFF